MSRARSWAFAAGGWAALFGLCTGACSIAFDLDRAQCESASDCEQRGFEGATCVDSVCVEPAGTGGNGGTGTGGSNEGGGGGPPLPENFACVADFTAPETGDMVHHTIRFESAIGKPGTPPSNPMVDVCNKLDVNCASPLNGADPLIPEADGTLELDLAASFGGYLKVTAQVSDPPTDIMPTLVFFQTPVVNPPTEKVIRLVDQGTLQGLADLADVELDFTRGISIILTDDCNDERASGVHLDSDDKDENTTPYHFRGSFPAPDATETDMQGAGGFVNMPVGDFTVVAYVASTGDYIGQTTLFSRAGTVSYAPVGPTEH